MSKSGKPARRLSRLVVAALPLLGGCANTSYGWSWYLFDPSTERGSTNLMFLAGGFWATIQISVLAILLSTSAGLVIAILGMSKSRTARMINRGYVEFIRAIPLLVIALWVYYGLPIMLGIQLSVFAAGLLALALGDSAFEAEVFRAGIQSIEKGQTEAARSLGLKGWQIMRLVILPQAIRRILPALGNQFIYVLKMSSLLSVIGYQDLTRRANELTVTEYRPLEIYTILVLEYLVLILIVSWLVRQMEHRLARAG